MRVFGGGGCSARASTAVGGARGANCVRGGWYASNGEDGWGARVEAAHGRRRWREGRGELLWMNGSLRREEENEKMEKEGIMVILCFLTIRKSCFAKWFKNIFSFASKATFRSKVPKSRFTGEPELYQTGPSNLYMDHI